MSGIGLAWLDERQMIHRRKERVLCQGCGTPLNGYNPGPFCHACDAKEATKRFLAELEKGAEEERRREQDARNERARERDRQRRRARRAEAKALADPQKAGRPPNNLPLDPPTVPPGPGDPHVYKQRFWSHTGRARIRTHLWVTCCDCGHGRWTCTSRFPQTPEAHMERVPRCHPCQSRVNMKAVNAARTAT